ncbi:MAG TPA: hypothetical protein PKV72_00215 [Candidatus Peribacteria bacterium]|nr:hypothetical protein [Candidatus Peribacteria bacterium]
MNSPEPPQLDPFNVIRGAVADAVLQSGELPGVPYDRHADPEVYRRAVADHLQHRLRPRVERYIREELPDETVRVLHALVTRYNEFLHRHAGERMVNSDFYPSRPPMDPFEAMAHPVSYDEDVAASMLSGDMALASEHGPATALDFVRMTYLKMLQETRAGLAQVCTPVAGWQSESSAHWRRVGESHFRLLPFVYRNAEEFVALHAVAGRVTDLPTHSANDRPPLSPLALKLLHESALELSRYRGIIAQLRRRANRVLEAYGEHRATEAQRSGLGRLVMSYACPFPEEDCKRLQLFVRTEHRLENAEKLAGEIHAAWQQSLALDDRRGENGVRESYTQVHAALREVGDLVEMLVEKVLDGYEGK